MKRHSLLASAYRRVETFAGLLRHLWDEGRWWAIPILIAMVIALAIVTLAGSAGVSPFLYPFF